MGGVGTIAALGTGASAVSTGLAAVDMINGRKSGRNQLASIRRQQNQNMQKKQNILENQLAKRRASLGAMGVSATGSAEVSHQSMIDNAYDEINNDNYEYDTQYSNLYNDEESQFNRKLFGSIMGGADTATRILK